MANMGLPNIPIAGGIIEKLKCCRDNILIINNGLDYLCRMVTPARFIAYPNHQLAREVKEQIEGIIKELTANMKAKVNMEADMTVNMGDSKEDRKEGCIGCKEACISRISHISHISFDIFQYLSQEETRRLDRIMSMRKNVIASWRYLEGQRRDLLSIAETRRKEHESKSGR